MDARYYTGLKEVKLVTTVDEVNKMLLSGWEMLKPTEIHDPNATTRIHYLMGLFGEVREKAPSRPTQSPPASRNLDQDVLNLPWEESDYQGVDKWVSAEKVGGAIKEYFQKNGEKTDKGSYHLVVGSFDMYLGPKGSISRYKKK